MIDLKEWDIDTQVCEEVEMQKNPFSSNRNWLINNKYFLKASNHDFEKQTKLLRRLLGRGLPVLAPYMWKTVEKGGYYFQLYDYIPQNMSRIDYEKEEYASKIADILSKFSKQDADDMLNLREDTMKVLSLLSTEDPDILSVVNKALAQLEENLFVFLVYFEKRFSHGDFHPLNILWENNKIKAIIDFEVAGKREELYDLAFLIGCVGMDNPNELQNKWIKTLLTEYVKLAQPTKLAYELLPELIIATRLRWLVIWLSSSRDKKIAKMETKFISIILKHIEQFSILWISYAGDFLYSKKNWVMQDAYIVHDIEKAKKRTENIDIFNPKIISDKQAEELSTDLRLLAIDFGMKNDIISVLKILKTQKKLSEEHDLAHVNMEYSVTMGNSSLDFNKFRLVCGLKELVRNYEELLKNNPHEEELRMGFSFILRNSSIQMAEIGNYEKAFEFVDKQMLLAELYPQIEIFGELARTLSNAITSSISENFDKHELYWQKLKKLYEEHPKSRKIEVAYKVAKTNLKKFT